MKKFLIPLLLLVAVYANAQMLNDSPFNSNVVNPKYKKGAGPKMLIDAGHYNFIVHLGLIKPLLDLSVSDGYRPVVDSMIFTTDYLSKYDVVIIMPALPFKFGTKKQVTTESTFTTEEINNLHNWVEQGGSLLVFSEHAPIDLAMTPLLNKFGIASSIGIAYDTVNCDTTVKGNSAGTLLNFTKQNGLLNTAHPIITGSNESERVNNIQTYGGAALSGASFTNILQLSTTAGIKKWSGSGPVVAGNSQCLAGNVGKGKLVAMGDCNGFTAMYVDNSGKKFSAGMQVEKYDWKQFVLNTLHWLSN